MALPFKRIGVAGCGLMGSGIAQVCAQAGIETWVLEKNQASLDQGLRHIEKSLAKLTEKGKLTASEQASIFGRLHPTLRLEDFKDCEFVIEAISENLPEKIAVFRRLDEICSKDVIFASNTSSLTIMKMAAATKRAEKFVGMHFFNPVPIMKLVEVIETLTTSADTLQRTLNLAQTLGKKAVRCKDTPGFIVNLLLIPYLFDAIRAVQNQTATIADVDQAMMLGCGHPMGPLTLADFVGLDTLMAIGEILFEGYRDAKYAPPALLTKMVHAGFMGKKSGQGFYDYRSGAPTISDLRF